jgi:tetratricopeptide (TPR) repeat protein
MKADPGEIDTLIACYHLPNPGAEFRKTVVAAIRREADAIRRQIAEQPDNAESYNQFAWLVGNTEGNLDEALRCSQKSLELSPNTGSYLDTLAHVCFTRGDLEDAVRHQAKAAELEPHSGLIARKLEVFRAALEAKQKGRAPDANRQAPTGEQPPGAKGK